MTTYQAIGAPEGHRTITLSTDPTSWTCECGAHFTVRGQLLAHHRDIASGACEECGLTDGDHTLGCSHDPHQERTERRYAVELDDE